ncbi:MAG: hypothetical protein KDA22_04535 [Phycisphaerales bacterium]|nr:hypothetical protein [Phycisphaerales bacterium]
MRLHTRLSSSPAILAALGAISTALASNVPAAPPDGVRALDGDWIYVEDRTEGRAVEKHQPSMSAMVRLRIDDDAVVLLRSGDREIRMPLDGSATEVAGEGSTSRYRGAWKDGSFTYESEPVRDPGSSRTGGLIRWELRVTDEGLLASVAVDPPSGFTSVALYRHPEDIAMPDPAKAAIGDLAWLGGAWIGTRGTGGTTSIEERWSPPLGGAMLGVSRTVARERMRAFEYLRVVERDGGLVYIAQPGGRTATEFVLTELGDTHAVFENPRHDFPQRIVYERSAEGGLSASIGFAKGGRPQRFEFEREGKASTERGPAEADPAPGP